MKKRVQAGWSGWQRVSGVICDRKVSARVKGKIYMTVVRQAMLYGLEAVVLTKRQEAELEVAELKMLRFSLDTHEVSVRNAQGRVDSKENQRREFRACTFLESRIRAEA